VLLRLRFCDNGLLWKVVMLGWVESGRLVFGDLSIFGILCWLCFLLVRNFGRILGLWMEFFIVGIGFVRFMMRLCVEVLVELFGSRFFLLVRY